jgi:4-amino-4-deoxy-L-arabinose transferase-like glycosyltransferase
VVSVVWRFGHSIRLVAPSPGRVLFLLLVVLFLGRLGHRELYASHEARAAQNAQRMLDTGGWGRPVLFDGQADLQKPPGYYWLVAAAGWANGGRVDAFAARLPAAVAGLLTVALVWGFLRREGRPVAAWVAAVGLATAVHFTAVSRTARIDVPLTCAVTAALLAFYRGVAGRPLPPAPSPAGGGGGSPEPATGALDAGVRTDRTLSPPPPAGEGAGGRGLGFFLLSAAAAAAGVMLKGPVALALIGPAAVAWLVVAPRPADRRWRLPPSAAALGVLVLAALALPWFVWANHATGGEFARTFFWHHNVARFAGTSAALASHPWWYYGPRLAAAFLPWTPAAVALAVWAARSGLWRRDPLVRFGAVWAGAMFAVLSAAQFKRADYLLPLFPGLAVVFGCAAEAWLAAVPNPRTARRATWAFGAVVALVVVGWGVMTFAVEPREQRKEEKRAFAELIRSHAPPPAEVMLFRAESHLLAWHLGRPLVTRVEWHDLNDWLATPGPHLVVMPPEYVYPAQQIVRSRRLEVVARLEDLTPDKPARPLVLVRTAD